MDFQEIYRKAADYCSHSEHCRSQLLAKMRQWEAPESLHGVIFEKLEQENFLNENRYAELFVRSKVRQNSWGRLKIVQALRFNKVNEESIRHGLAALDETLYLEVLQEVISKAKCNIKEPNKMLRERKIIAHAASKGFELILIREMMKNEE